MHDQPRYEAFERNASFPDGRSARPAVAGTVARGQLELDELFFRGEEGGQPAKRFPFPVTKEDLQRGRERYDIYCSICHDHAGYGHGMAVERGMRQPTSFHDERLRAAPPGHFFGAITNGFGVMEDYADRIGPRDRWCIVAYVRALQLSQNVSVEELPPGVRERMEGDR